MKKIKRIIPFLLALIMVFAIPLAACDSCNDNGTDDPVDQETKTLLSISVNADGAKTEFVVGDEFTAAGLVVKATLQNSASQENEEVTLSSGDYKVDSSAYNKEKAGNYSIKVSYTYEEVTKDASYNVAVVPKQDGIEVALADGVKDTYDLSKEQPTAEIDTTKIVVKDYNGETISDYSVKLYKGQDEVTLTDDGKATVGGGAYAIWVEKESSRYPGYMLSSFVVVYVNDDIDSVVVKSGVGIYTQPEGVDLISGTWVFTVNYVSGVTKDVKVADCKILIDTMKEGVKDASATYSDYNAKGEKISKTFNVPYTITKFTGRKVENAFSYSAITGVTTDNAVLDQSHFTGANAFLTVASGKVTYRTSPSVIQIENEGLKITIEGTGSITIGASSTGGSNTSRIGLKDAEGNYLPASYDISNANIGLDESEDEDGNVTENVYLVTGTSACTFTFVIAQPGTYTIVSTRDSAYDRGSRIHSISMIDYIPDASAAALASVDADNQTYIIDKKV